MPLYPGKTTIQALGGDRVEWKAKFEVNGSGVLEVTAPPSNVVRIINDAVTGLPIEFSIQIDCIGEVILEGYDWGYSERTYNPPLPPQPFDGVLVCQWNQATRTMTLQRRTFTPAGGGAAEPRAMARGDIAWLTLWLRNTAVPITYSQEVA